MVTIPLKWCHDSTKEKIDEFLGEGTFDEYGKFDPNNLTRIALPWTVKDTTAIFNKLDKEYHVTMDKYTMGTGGGPGDDANFAAWQQRDECHVVRYTTQPSNIYLSLVHTWDKQFGYPFVSLKDPLPNECAIDSIFDISSGVGGDDFDDDIGGDDINYSGITRTPPTSSSDGTMQHSMASTSASTTLSTFNSRRPSRREKGITKALEELSEQRSESNRMTSELMSFIQSQAAPVTSTVVAGGGSNHLQPHDVLEHITKTRKLLSEYCDEIKSQRITKELIRSSNDSTDVKKRKITHLLKDIVDNKKMVATLQQTLKHQRLQLESMTKKGNDNNDEFPNNDDVSIESGMSSIHVDN